MLTRQVEILITEPVRVAALEFCGDPARLDDSIRRFAAWRREHGLSPAVSATYNVFHPHVAGLLHLELCAAYDGEVGDDLSGLISKEIPGGRCARLRHIGDDTHLGEAIAYLYTVWLPQSGETR